MTIQYHLYSSEGCHLCELAQELIEQVFAKEAIKIVDIVEHEHLVQEYGVHIPVLEKLSDNSKLFWPFDLSQVEALR